MKFLIVGLGNIGFEYQNTRHNIGFSILDAWAKVSNVDFTLERHAHTAEIKFKGKKFILIKPTTYMNLSGKAVNYWLQKEKISINNCLIVVDDLALPFGTLRIKIKGSDAGHNGLKDIQEVLGHSKYPRLRFGIGQEFQKGNQVNHVLGDWTNDEEEKLAERINKCIEAVKSFGTIGIARTMNFFNGK